jgi:dTDP-4-amino-4,6-dideoxygalactose transaminase
MSIEPTSPVVPINDLQRIVSDRPEALLDAVRDVVLSGWWLNGKQTREFCSQFASYLGVAHCQGVANGTDALEIALRALTFDADPEKREVITVANAGGYSTIACRLVGLVPVYVDIEEASQLASLQGIVDAITDRTAVIIVTHLYGGIVDVAELRRLMAQKGHSEIPILEDCAQSHGVMLDGKRAGTFGDIATFSFYPTKNLGAFGDGGAIVTGDAALAERCEMLRQYGWSKKYQNRIHGGRNSRLDEIQAAVLLQLLPGLDKANARRVAILDRYQRAAGAGLKVVRSAGGTVAHLAVVLCDDRASLQNHLTRLGIQHEIHYPVLDCDQEAWRDQAYRIASGDLPVSRASVSRNLTLPCFPGMTDEEVNRVCEAIASWKP